MVRADRESALAALAFEVRAGILITDHEGIIIAVNRGFTRVTGYDAAEVVGRRPSMLGSGRHDADFYQQLWRSIREDGYWQGEIWNRRKDGRIYAEWLEITAVWSVADHVRHYVGTFHDITESIQADAVIHRLAYYDSLTGLPNRRLFQDRLEQAIEATARSQTHGAVLLLDVDNFKSLNDTRGHAAGDKLIAEISRRLRPAVRDTDTVARLGGDEFAVLIEDLGERRQEAASNATHIGAKLRELISQPYEVDGFECRVTASVGVSLFSAPDTASDLLRRTDLTMYHAKTIGRNSLQFFDPTMQERLEERSALEADLNKALEAGQLRLLYQPQIDAGGRVVGAEALLRWLHPSRGMLAPDRFLELAEESGLIVPIGRWVLQTACDQLRAWQTAQALADLRVAVNVSARQFRQDDFVAQVQSALEQSAVRPDLLKLELTETIILDDIGATVDKMNALSQLGVGMALDDFGTGYSSLSYLTRLPLDQLKIDRSFVINLPENQTDAVVARTILTMARSLSLDVIAEGVETEEQRDFLYRHGCESYQGYLFSKPLAAATFESFVRQHPGDKPPDTLPRPVDAKKLAEGAAGEAR